MDIPATIYRHGVALVGVDTDHPYDQAWTYTIGRHDRGGPELLVFSNDTPLAAAVLNELTPARRGLPPLTPGSPVEVTALDGHRVDFRRARLPWANMHCVMAFEEQGVEEPDGIDVLQVVLPDAHGNLPGEADRPLECSCCPDTSREDGWLYSLPLQPKDLRWCGVDHGRPHDVDEGLLVAAHVWHDGDQFVGREELVPARRLSDTTVEILAPPVLADWTTAGAVHRLEPDLGRFGHPVLGPEIAPPAGVHLCWATTPALFDGGGEDADQVLSWLLTLPGVVCTITEFWLSVTARPAEAKRVRSRLRRLERDGLLISMPRYSQPSVGCTNLACSCRR